MVGVRQQREIILVDAFEVNISWLLSGRMSYLLAARRDRWPLDRGQLTTASALPGIAIFPDCDPQMNSDKAACIWSAAATTNSSNVVHP